MDRPNISGLVSGFLGGLSGSFTFICVYNAMTWKIYTEDKYRSYDFRYKNYLIFVTSDFWAWFTRIFFETRKQIIQMWNKDVLMSHIARGWYLGLVPMIVRDFLFRSTLLSVFYTTQRLEQKTKLKFTVSEIIDYLKYCREDKGEVNATYQSKLHLFIEFHNYENKTAMNIRFLIMIFANLIGTLVTNPIDVWMTKLITQNQRKYTGLLNCLRTVYKEEGVWKFMAGIHPRFMFNSINGILFLYIYDQVITTVHDRVTEEQRYDGL